MPGGPGQVRPDIADRGAAPWYVAGQFQVPLLNLKRPQPQFLDSRARLPEKLVSVCHVSC
jgi:hypothetical protein